jgi:transcriptional regulator with XRE-family HTH domain
MHFPQHLKRERELRGWSQARMAQELGTTPNTISVWERGLSLPSPYFREKLYTLFGKNALELGLLEEDAHSAESMAEPERNGEQKILEEAHFTSPRMRSVQSPSGSAADNAFMQNKGEEVVAYPIRSVPLTPQKALAQPHFAPRKRLLIAAICVSLLGLLSGTLLLLLPRLLIPSNPYAPYQGSLILNDALSDQNPQVNWQEGLNANRASCQFKQGAYHAFQPRQGYFHACIAQLTDFSNFAYEVDMTILHGDYAGILFRAVDSIDSHYYLFRVNKDGSYAFKRYIDGVDNDAIMLDTGFSQAYHPAQKNRVAVAANGNRLTLYINGQNLVTVSDAAYLRGQIGVLAGSEQQAPAEAAFSNLRVWAW